VCGIAGVLNLNGEPVPLSLVQKMCDALQHRGPDGEGQYLDGNLGLGHRRLAIIDLTPAAHQPMVNEDGTMIIVYNGEVYNYLKLRAELEARGHRFCSRSDTEVVLHGYEEWGEDCVRRLNGMFAFAIWDKCKQTLFLARDRYGIKPLYYFWNGTNFLFATEIKALLESPRVPRKVCLEGLAEYFTFQNIFSNNTLLQGIRLLPAAHTALISMERPEPVFHQYWDYDFSGSNERKLAFDDAAQELRQLLEQAVVRQLMSDVPLGSYLSGGMDSGSLVAIASQTIPRMMTFTGGFDLSSVSGLELHFDEREAAEQMASQFMTEHYEMVLHSGDMAWVMPKLIWHLEDLRVGMSYQNWYIARLASKFVKVVLSGGGGDELFAGYPWRYLPLLNCKTVGEFDQICYRAWQRLVPEEERGEFFQGELRQVSKERSAWQVFQSMLPPASGPGQPLNPGQALNRNMYFEAKTFLHGLLVIEDKISSAHSLETRVPYLDNDLVDFALSLPPSFKLDIVRLSEQGSNREPVLSSDGKRIFRQAMRGLVPQQILDKKKQGFSPPDQSWYRGETMSYIREILLESSAIGRGYFNPAYVQRVVEEHIQGKVNHRLLIWSLLCFEWWHRIFIDGERSDLS